MRLARLLCILVLALAFTPVPARAGALDGVGDADRVEIRGIIERQLAAFQRDDGATAFGFASPTIRAIFGTPENFMSMVRDGYAPVYRPREVEFQDLADIDGVPTQRVLLVGPDGRVWELQLKGAGKTPYSRMGDGRAVLRSSIREFLCSEAMHALGIPTTRALAVVGSDYPVFRETVESAAVVTRMAPSFVRFGSFEYFYWQQRYGELRELADYVISTFYPELEEAPCPYLALLEEVARRTARLVAHWQAVGFCHGVMNTDNMSILGLTIDYGPFGFIDGFDAGHVCNHSDEQGRYAYHRQPQIAHWNLYCLGQALVALTEDVEATQAAIEVFKDEFAQALDERLHAKLGLATVQPGDEALIERTIELLHTNRADWTLFWRRLAMLRVDAANPGDDAPVRDLIADRAAFDAWAAAYRARLRRESSIDAERAARMNRVNPKYVLRNYLAEIAIRKARGDESPRDFGEVARLLEVLQRPYDEQPEFDDYARLPPEWSAGLHLSCSS